MVAAVRAQGLPLLVVDDGSSDGTGAEAAAAGAQVLRLEPNRGKGAALKAGFREALAARPARRRRAGSAKRLPLRRRRPVWAAFLTLDGDGQHDPSEIPRLLEAWERTGADLVVGTRDYSDMPPIRWFTNSVSRALFSWALGQRIPDNQSGYRLHSRRIAEAALASEEQGFAFEVEEIAICVGRGLPPGLGAHQDDLRHRKERHQALDALLQLHRVTRGVGPDKARRPCMRFRGGPPLAICIRPGTRRRRRRIAVLDSARLEPKSTTGGKCSGDPAERQRGPTIGDQGLLL